MNSKHVDIYIGKLNDFLNRKQHDFPDFRTFNEYKK
ncbi:ACP synthase, partial [Acinetobacter baumannii]